MTPLNLQAVTEYVEEKIGEFHLSRLEKVQNIKLSDILLDKNPYLFKAKNITSPDEVIRSTLDALISSSEETKFGDWMERLAIFINDSVFQGRKAAVEGMDLDFDRDGKRFLISIKSGPNWGNKGQQQKLGEYFSYVKGRLSTSGALVNAVFVNGCCYGRSRQQSEYKVRYGYYKVCGQRFWELISAEPDLYTKLIIPLAHEAEAKNEEFKQHYDALINRLTFEFMQNFMTLDGFIDWNKWLVFNSSFPEKQASVKRAATKRGRGGHSQSSLKM